MWSKKYCDSNGQNLSEVLKGFLDYIHFHMIPANVLMKEINPLGIVPHCIIMNALAYQADPSSVEPMKPSAVKEVRLGEFKKKSCFLYSISVSWKEMQGSWKVHVCSEFFGSLWIQLDFVLIYFLSRVGSRCLICS